MILIRFGVICSYRMKHAQSGWARHQRGFLHLNLIKPERRDVRMQLDDHRNFPWDFRCFDVSHDVFPVLAAIGSISTIKAPVLGAVSVA